MPLSRLETGRFAGVLLALALAGCNSPQMAKDDEPDASKNPIIGHFAGDDLYANLPDGMVKIPDDSVHFAGEKDYDAEEVAKWATERRDIITWCINQHIDEMNEFGATIHRYKRVWPNDDTRLDTRYDQAVAISYKVVEKIPDNTRERVRLAQSLFNKGSAEYWAIDACMNRVNVLRAQVGDDEENKDPKFKDQIAEIRKLRKTAEAAKKRMFAYHSAALKNFQTYQSAMPMDKTALDYIWKIHFELGNFREAVRVMNDLLNEDIIIEEKRVEYLKIRKEINDYLVEVEINKDAPKPGSRSAKFKDGNEPQ